MATKAKSKKTEAPRQDLADREPTAMHEAYAEWITEQTGIEVDVKSIQLGTLLRGEFQKSEVNQTRMAEAKAEKERLAEEREAKRQEREAAKAEKAEAAKARKAAAAEKKAAKPAAKPAAKKAAAPAKKATGGPRRRPAAKKG